VHVAADRVLFVVHRDGLDPQIRRSRTDRLIASLTSRRCASPPAAPTTPT
jgi:hypothetical protein